MFFAEFGYMWNILEQELVLTQLVKQMNCLAHTRRELIEYLRLHPAAMAALGVHRYEELVSVCVSL